MCVRGILLAWKRALIHVEQEISLSGFNSLGVSFLPCSSLRLGFIAFIVKTISNLMYARAFLHSLVETVNFFVVRFVFLSTFLSFSFSFFLLFAWNERQISKSKMRQRIHCREFAGVIVEFVVVGGVGLVYRIGNRINFAQSEWANEACVIIIDEYACAWTTWKFLHQTRYFFFRFFFSLRFFGLCSKF